MTDPEPTPIMLRVDPALAEKIKAAAKRQERSVNNYLCIVLEQQFAVVEPSTPYGLPPPETPTEKTLAEKEKVVSYHPVSGSGTHQAKPRPGSR